MAQDFFFWFIAALQAVLVFAMAPLAVGVARKVKAAMQSRRGSPIFQPYWDWFKLLSKRPVQSTASSWVFSLAPLFSFASVLAAAALLPILFAGGMPIGDIIVFFYLFAIPRFFTALAGLDVASSFGGIGSSRELLFSAVIEPALFALILFFATFDSHTGLTALFGSFSLTPNAWLSPAHWLAIGAFFILALAELGRLPFDNPATHLELTMVHEAMMLDYSGPGLALMEWAQGAKIVLWLSLLAAMVLPISTGGILASALLWISSVLALAALVAAVESLTPKLRLFKAPELVVFALILAFMAYLTRVLGLGADRALVFLAFAMLICNLYFLFSATFRRRLEIYFAQSVALALILALVALQHGGADAIIRLVTTLVFKVVLIPWFLYKAFKAVAGESKIVLNADPLYLKAPVSTSGALIVAGFLIGLSFLVSSYLGANSLLLPVAIAIILTGGLVISSKSHVLLQLMGFLLLENGLVLLPLALSVELPLIGEATALFDTLTLIVVALVLVFKINTVIDSLDSETFDKLAEGK